MSYFTSHIGIPTIMMAVPMFILTTRIPFSRRLQPLVDRMLPLTFGIYLTHMLWCRLLCNLTLRVLEPKSMMLPAYGLLIFGLTVMVFILSAITTAVILKIPYLRRVV